MSYYRPMERKRRPRQRTRIGGRPAVTQQVQTPQGLIARGQQGGGGIPMGGSSTTTGPAQVQGQQEDSSPLAGLLAAKETYDQTNKAYKGGQNIAAKAKTFGGDLYRSGEDAITGLNDMFSDTSSLTNAGADQLLRSPDITNMLGGGTASRMNLPGGISGGVQNLDTIMDPAFQFGSTGQTGFNGLPPELSEAMVGNPEIMGEPVTGLVSNSPKVAGGVDALGAAGAGLGVGLNISDMVNNGLSFGNVTGAIGSGLLGYSAMTGGPTNPIGLAFLGASFADQIFDIF